MGEGDTAVHPGGRLKGTLRVQLSCREHHQSLLPINHVAINIDVGEVVVLTHRLQLVECLLERTVVPEARVGKRLGVVGNRRSREFVGAVVLALRPAVEAEGQPRHADVVGDVRLLERVLIWGDLEALDKLWIETGEHSRCAEPDGHGQHKWPC